MKIDNNNPKGWKLAATLAGGLLIPSLFLLFVIANTDISFDTNQAKQVAKLSWQWAFGEHQQWYNWVMFGVIVFPFLLSFDKRVAFYKQWRWVLPAVLANAAFFIPWDIFFTKLGVWGFNNRYFEDTYAGLPLGEWLFFIFVPYACLFVYECLLVYFPNDILYKYDKPITWIIIALLAIIAVFCWQQIYTAWAFGLAAGLLLAHYWAVPNTYRTRFYSSFVVCLLPFLITNGILTGAVNQEPVVIYNDAHNLANALHGARLVTIPFDDFAYGFLLLFIPTIIFEECRRKTA